MRQLKGPFLIIWKDFKIQLYIFSAITLLLVTIFNIVGFYFQPEYFYPFMSGPIYGFLLIMPFFMFHDPFRAATGLGATRMNYISGLMGNYLLIILLFMVVHNVLYQATEIITENTASTVQITHLADIVAGTGVMTHFWVDILIGVFLVGTGTIVSAFLYRFGYVPTLGTTLAVGILAFLWITLGDTAAIFNWIVVNMYSLLHILALIGVIGLLLTYPMMKHVTLKN